MRFEDVCGIDIGAFYAVEECFREAYFGGGSTLVNLTVMTFKLPIPANVPTHNLSIFIP